MPVVRTAEIGMQDAIGRSGLNQRPKDWMAINTRLLRLLSSAAERWRIEIDAVKIMDVDISRQVQRAIAREAEAIRENRAHHRGRM